MAHFYKILDAFNALFPLAAFVSFFIVHKLCGEENKMGELKNTKKFALKYFNTLACGRGSAGY